MYCSKWAIFSMTIWEHLAMRWKTRQPLVSGRWDYRCDYAGGGTGRRCWCIRWPVPQRRRLRQAQVVGTILECSFPHWPKTCNILAYLSADLAPVLNTIIQIGRKMWHISASWCWFSTMTWLQYLTCTTWSDSPVYKLSCDITNIFGMRAAIICFVKGSNVAHALTL